jgi:hypothetical protein
MPSEQTVHPDVPTFSAPAIDPVPLSIGYAFADDLDTPRVHRVGASDDPAATYTFELGPATRAMFDRLMPALFQEASPSPGPNTAGTVRIAITGAHAQRMPVPAYATITYSLSFIGPDGSDDGVWRVQETSRGGGALEEEMMRAMRQAATTIAFDLAQRPEVRAWLDPEDSLESTGEIE